MTKPATFRGPSVLATFDRAKGVFVFESGKEMLPSEFHAAGYRPNDPTAQAMFTQAGYDAKENAPAMKAEPVRDPDRMGDLEPAADTPNDETEASDQVPV